MEAGWLGVLLLGGLPRTEIAALLIAQRAALTASILALGALSYLASLLFPFEADDRRRTTDDERPAPVRETNDV